MRIEQLPGANRPPRPADLSKASFAPHTFVPNTNVDGQHDDSVEHYEPGTAGRKPWSVFLLMTVVFACLWLLSCVLICCQVWGITPLSLAPQLEQEGPVTALLELDRNPPWLQGGKQIPTVWPHGNVHPIGLACDGASKTMVVSSRFGLYAADLSGPNRIQFENAPACEEVEGESLQDVSLQCSGAACQANVLYQRGQRVATCALHASGANSTGHHAATNIAGQWLDGGSGADKTRVQALMLSSQCSGKKQSCAYVGTSDQRVVEMQESVDSEGTRALFPKRLLMTKKSISASVPGGGMDLIHDRFLGFLQRDGRRLQVLDLKTGGAIAGLWRLPDHPDEKAWIPEGKAWTAMCAAGDDLYLLSKGLSPQLWRFQVPKALQK
jgi:hypothetical protein